MVCPNSIVIHFEGQTTNPVFAKTPGIFATQWNKFVKKWETELSHLPPFPVTPDQIPTTADRRIARENNSLRIPAANSAVTVHAPKEPEVTSPVNPDTPEERTRRELLEPSESDRGAKTPSTE
jgi:hypothetical protein